MWARTRASVLGEHPPTRASKERRTLIGPMTRVSKSSGPRSTARLSAPATDPGVSEVGGRTRERNRSGFAAVRREQRGMEDHVVADVGRTVGARAAGQRGGHDRARDRRRQRRLGLAGLRAGRQDHRGGIGRGEHAVEVVGADPVAGGQETGEKTSGGGQARVAGTQRARRGLHDPYAHPGGGEAGKSRLGGSDGSVDHDQNVVVVRRE